MIDMQYFDRVGQAKKAYARVLEPIAKKWALTQNELDVVLFLYNNPTLDRAADIVSRRGISKSHVSVSVSSLESRNLLARLTGGDRRASHLSLTDAGCAIAREGVQAQHQFYQQLFNGVTEEELAAWESISQKVSQNLQHMGI